MRQRSSRDFFKFSAAFPGYGISSGDVHFVMRQATRMAANVFLADTDCRRYFARDGWGSMPGQNDEAVFEMEKRRQNGKIPCAEYFAAEECRALAEGLESKEPMFIYEGEAPQVVRAKSEYSFLHAGDIPDNTIAIIDISKSVLWLRDAPLYAFVAAMIAYEAFLSEGPSVYAALASPKVAGPLWLLLFTGYERNEKDVKAAELCTERLKLVDKVLLVLDTKTGNASSPVMNFIMEIKAIFAKQMEIQAKMRYAVKEQRLLRSSSGCALI
jgi:hypothetical protein